MRLITSYKRKAGGRDLERSTNDAAVYSYKLQAAWWRSNNRYVNGQWIEVEGGQWVPIGRPVDTMRSLVAQLRRSSPLGVGHLGLFSVLYEDRREVARSQVGLIDRETFEVEAFPCMGLPDPGTRRVWDWMRRQGGGE